MSVCTVLAALVSSSEADTFVPKARVLVSPIRVHWALIMASGLGLPVSPLTKSAGTTVLPGEYVPHSQVPPNPPEKFADI